MARSKRGVVRYFVYILSCSDGSLYTGITTDPNRRLDEHNRGEGAKYTRGRRPVRLSYMERVASKSGALKRENELKRMSRISKLLLCSQFRKPRYSYR